MARSAAELATELRREFERAMLERYGQTSAQDPVLATLFHATAVQLARVYEEAEQVFPEAVFDDLVSGLGMPGRVAEPAQTVVAFEGAVSAELVTADFPIVGITRRGEHLNFAVDVPLRIGPARLRFAGVAEGGQLAALPGATLPDPPGAVGATPLPVPASVVPLAGAAASVAPTLFLAFEASDAHLSGLGLFIDTQTADHAVAQALARSVWQLLADDAEAGGVAREELMLRPHTGPGGARLLGWQDESDPMPAGDSSPHHPYVVPVGPYGPLCWIWPDVPVHRQVRSHAPRAIRGALASLVPAGYEHAYDRPLVWVQVALPAGTRGAAGAIQRVVAHCVPASNVETYAERVGLGDLGKVVAFRPEGIRGRHLLALLSVTGEHGDRYLPESDLTADLSRGRYRERNGELDIRPAATATGRTDHYVMARFLHTDGERAEGLEPGDVAGRGARLGNVGATVRNIVAARGESAPPRYASARIRFAERLRTRERVVTAADYDIVARAFESRVLGATVASQVELGDDRVPHRVEVVTVRVRAADFGDLDAELPRLAARLETHLQERVALGTRVRVQARVRDA